MNTNNMKEDPALSEKYIEELKCPQTIQGYAIEQLAKKTGYSVKEVKKELKKMEKKGYVKCYDLDGEKIYELTATGTAHVILKKMPKAKSTYTSKQLDEITRMPWPSTRWHLELLEERGTIERFEIGKARVYKPKKKTQS